MKRRHLLVSAGALAGVSGCISVGSRSGEQAGHPQNDSVTRQSLLSCSEGHPFSVAVGNRTNSSQRVTLALKQEGELVVRAEKKIQGDGAEDDAFIVDGGCTGATYSVEFDVDGREPVEHSFAASYRGVLTANIHPDRVFVAFQGAD